MSQYAIIRICLISFILCVGYGINFISILRAIVVGKIDAEIWLIVYIASSIWLFISCLVMIIITLFGFKIEVLSSNKRITAVCLIFIGLCGYIPSSVTGLLSKNNNGIIYWPLQLLYSLLPLYLACIIYFFPSKTYSQIINLLLFSSILFTTPLIRLISIIKSLPLQPLPEGKIISFSLICFATSILILIHIIFVLKHYNSGLFLKCSIMACLTYSIVQMMIKQIDFDEYDPTWRIYVYYFLLAATFIIYSLELLVQAARKVVQLDAKSVVLSPSFDFENATVMNASINDVDTRGRNTSILQTVRDKLAPADDENKVAHIYSLTDSNERVEAIRANPNVTINTVIKIFADFKPCRANRKKYFNEITINTNAKNIDRRTDSICAIVPFYNESASEIHATLRSLYLNFDYIKKKESRYKFTHFNVLLVGDGWFKASLSAKRYLAKLYNCCTQVGDNFESFYQEKHKHNTVVLQSKHNKKLCINPFGNNEKRLFLKVSTIIKIDNRKKANSHEWFLGKYGFAEWCKCDYMFFTDAYSTMNPEGMYEMLVHMKRPKNQDVVCCTGRARVYTIEQELYLKNLLRQVYPEQESDHEEDSQTDEQKQELEESDQQNEEENKYDHDIDDNKCKWWKNGIFVAQDEDTVDIMADDSTGENVFYKIQDIEFDHRLTTNAHLRACQMFEFEALYGTLGCYLLGGFLPVIPGPCGFYRSKYLLMNQVRGWYFEKINQKNDPLNMDLVLGNMKLAEDRMLTISSILNCDVPVRHSLITNAIFYFDPIPDLTNLMKQRRRWLNGSVATVVFVLRKISFSQWNVNFVRRYYVLLMWYMQLLMYVVVALSPPLIFAISFKYGLATILNLVLVDDGLGNKQRQMNTTITIFMIIAWIMYLLFIFFVHGQKWIKFIQKKSIVQITLILSYMFGTLILVGTFIQIFELIWPKKSKDPHQNTQVAKFFNYVVIVIYLVFFTQSFILAPMVSRDIKTLTILLKTCLHYFIYSPFYVTFFFINAIANIHDLSWGTRPDNVKDEFENNNPKHTTTKLLFFVIFIDIIIGCAVQPFTQQIYTHIIFFGLLALPSLYQIVFSIVWLIKQRLFSDLWGLCIPRKMNVKIEYTGLSNYRAPKVHQNYVELVDQDSNI